jgi:hypothetical protein
LSCSELSPADDIAECVCVAGLSGDMGPDTRLCDLCAHELLYGEMGDEEIRVVKIWVEINE